MATLRKHVRANGLVRWQIDYIDPAGRRIRRNFKRKGDAEAELAKRVSLIAEDRYLDAKKVYDTTLAELKEVYAKNHRHQPSWPDKLRYINNFISSYPQGTRADQIRFVDVETYRTDLINRPVFKTVVKVVKRKGKLVRRRIRDPRPRKASSVNREMSTIRHLFKKAVEWELIDRSPFDRGKSLLLKENNARLRYLTAEEITRLLDQAPEYLGDIIEAVINTGMRRGEVLSLRWRQIRDGFIYLEKKYNPIKTGKARQVPVNDDLADLFKRIRKRQGLSSEYVFTFNGRPVQDVHIGLNAALKQAGIQDFTFHDLRHTFASHFVMRGGNIKDLQEILGHRNIAMTMRYAHLSQEHKKKAVNLLVGLTTSSENSPMSPDVTEGESSDK